MLAAFADRGINVPVTLTVGGVVIFGDLITEDEYFERISRVFPDEPPDEEAPEDTITWKEAFRSFPSMFDEIAMDVLAEGANPEDVQEQRQNLKEPFVHLRDTRVWTAQERFLGFEGAYWRGKLSAVDGFWFNRPSAADYSRSGAEREGPKVAAYSQQVNRWFRDKGVTLRCTQCGGSVDFKQGDLVPLRLADAGGNTMGNQGYWAFPICGDNCGHFEWFSADRMGLAPDIRNEG